MPLCLRRHGGYALQLTIAAIDWRPFFTRWVTSCISMRDTLVRDRLLVFEPRALPDVFDRQEDLVYFVARTDRPFAR